MSTQTGMTGLYERRGVSKLSELRCGDHIRVDRGVYHHHMMVVRVVSADEVAVIHYAGAEGLTEVDGRLTSSAVRSANTCAMWKGSGSIVSSGSVVSLCQ